MIWTREVLFRQRASVMRRVRSGFPWIVPDHSEVGSGGGHKTELSAGRGATEERVEVVGVVAQNVSSQRSRRWIDFKNEVEDSI